MKDSYKEVPYNPEDWGPGGKKPNASPKPCEIRGPLKVHPDKAREAISLLEEFVRERAALMEDRHVHLKDTVTAIKLMDALYRFKEELAERIKSPVEKAYDKMRFTIVPEFMTDSDITTITVEDVGRCNVQDDVSVKVEDKEALKEWLIENEKEDMITESVNAQTLTAFIRQRMKAGEDTPGLEILKVTPVVRATITRSK